MDIALDVIGRLLDELAPPTRCATSDEMCEAFVGAIKKLSADQLEEYAEAFEQLGAVGLARMCRRLALEKLPVLH